MTEREYVAVGGYRMSPFRILMVLLAAGLWIAGLLVGVLDDTPDAEWFWGLLLGGLTFGVMARD